MKQLICEMCGSTDLVKQEGVFVCQSCSSKYSVEEARRMMVEGTVEVTGKVKVDNTAKLDNLYKVARRAKEDDNTDQAFKYYEQLNMEDPDNWESAFFVAYYSAVNKLKNDKEGDSVLVTGDTVKLGGNYRSGIGPAINTITNCLDSVFSLIEDIQEYEEQKAAVEAVSNYVKSISGNLNDIISGEYDRMKREIGNFGRQTEGGVLGTSNMLIKNNNTRRGYEEDVRNILALAEKRKQRLEEVVGKRRFDEYWAAHQSEKAELESEKQSLTEKIAALNEEITTVPQKTDGYDTMVELQKKIENLTSEKKALGLFKLKEKKAVQVQIDSTNNEIAPIQVRINSAIEEVQGRISPLQSRIDAIDTELTKPR
jgi:chromosome segregation ATPase